MNFARRNRVLTWLLGGLNYHKEHHLFPLICHVNYPSMSKVVEETCREFGIPYKEHPSFASGHRRTLPLAAADGDSRLSHDPVRPPDALGSSSLPPSGIRPGRSFPGPLPIRHPQGRRP